MKYVVYKFIRFFGRIIFKVLYFPKCEGVENIPNSGAVILAGNHTNNLDAAFMIGTPKRIVHVLSKSELFNTKFKNWFFKSMACIKVDRTIHDEKAKCEVIDILNNNGLVAIFPEGTHNKTKDIIMPFKEGTVKFASKTNAYIVPFAITGKYKLFHSGLKIKYGEAYKVTSDIESENNKLMNKVKEMILNEKNKNEIKK